MKPHSSSPPFRVEENLNTHGALGLERKDWAGLPKHLLGMVLDKLESTVDYLQFDSVCVSWHSAKKENHSRRLKKSPHEVPMLLVSSQERFKWGMCDVMHKIYSDSKLSVPYNTHFSSSSQGWLFIFNKDGTFTLYNPFSTDLESNTIHLPELDYEEHIELTLNPNESLVMAKFGLFGELAFFRVGKDKNWNKVNVPSYYGRRFMARDVLHYDNNRLYAVDRHGAVVSFEVTDSGHPNVNLVGFDRYIRCHNVKRYLVKSCKGEVIVVERYLYWLEEACISVHCRVFRLDLDTEFWTEIKSLDNMSLFVGGTSSISVMASNFVGCMPNCIYFSRDVDDAIFDEESPKPVMYYVCGVYHMNNATFVKHFVTVPSSTRFRRGSIWIIPSINQT